jgi:hypothetical protein
VLMLPVVSCSQCSQCTYSYTTYGEHQQQKVQSQQSLQHVAGEPLFVLPFSNWLPTPRTHMLRADRKLALAILPPPPLDTPASTHSVKAHLDKQLQQHRVPHCPRALIACIAHLQPPGQEDLLESDSTTVIGTLMHAVCAAGQMPGARMLASVQHGSLALQLIGYEIGAGIKHMSAAADTLT